MNQELISSSRVHTKMMPKSSNPEAKLKSLAYSDMKDDDDEEFEDALSDRKSISTAETFGSDYKLPPISTPPIPDRFIKGMMGDMEEAARRWEVTKKWREDNNVDEILRTPQPYFNFIKKNYPHFIHKPATNGCYVYIEQIGKGNIGAFWQKNISLDDLAMHYVFLTEYIWNIVDPREEGMLVSIFDLKGASMTELAGNTLKLVRRCTENMQAHYPERSAKMFVVNAPWWFQTAFTLISPFVDARTKKKIIVLGGNFSKTLLEDIPAENLPQSYGGTDLQEFGESHVEKDLLKFVKELNAKSGIAPVE